MLYIVYVIFFLLQMILFEFLVLNLGNIVIEIINFVLLIYGPRILRMGFYIYLRNFIRYG